MLLPQQQTLTLLLGAAHRLTWKTEEHVAHEVSVICHDNVAA
jgi:hypothetical protein